MPWWFSPGQRFFHLRFTRVKNKNKSTRSTFRRSKRSPTPSAAFSSSSPFCPFWTGTPRSTSSNSLSEMEDRLSSDNTILESVWKVVTRKGSSLLSREPKAYFATTTWGGMAKSSLLEGYVSLKPKLSFALDVGKIVTRWGTGYARNPVAFVDRLKDPEDPQEPLEGFYVVKADLNKSFDGPLKSVAFTPVLLPVTKDVNRSFGEPGSPQFCRQTVFAFIGHGCGLGLFHRRKPNREIRLGFCAESQIQSGSSRRAGVDYRLWKKSSRWDRIAPLNLPMS